MVPFRSKLSVQNLPQVHTFTLFLSSSLFHCLANSCSVCASLTDGKGFIAQKRRPESVGTSRDTDLEAASTHRNMLSSAMVSKVCASSAVGHCILFDSLSLNGAGILCHWMFVCSNCVELEPERQWGFWISNCLCKWQNIGAFLFRALLHNGTYVCM